MAGKTTTNFRRETLSGLLLLIIPQALFKAFIIINLAMQLLIASHNMFIK
jgi:hypothetical protein